MDFGVDAASALSQRYRPLLLYTFLLSLATTIPLFLAVEFGPWVGLVTIVAGTLIADYFVNHSLARPWYWYLSDAIFAFIPGFALLFTKGRYNNAGTIAIAVGFSAVGIVISNIVVVIGDGIVYHYPPTDYIGAFFGTTLANAVCLILLPILLIIYNAVTGGRASV
jgi:ECF-type riboflavin transporter, S component